VQPRVCPMLRICKRKAKHPRHTDSRSWYRSLPQYAEAGMPRPPTPPCRPRARAQRGMGKTVPHKKVLRHRAGNAPCGKESHGGGIHERVSEYSCRCVYCATGVGCGACEGVLQFETSEMQQRSVSGESSVVDCRVLI
jgi:hypothetical protein